MNDLAINVSTVKDLKSNFDNELNHFKNTSFDTFNNSYFKMCTDPYILRMNIKLSLMYDKLKSGYRNIDKWWTDYISNVEELEKTLSNDERAGLLETADIKNYINNNLQKLDDFKMSIAGIIATQIEQKKDSVKFANNEVVNNEDQFSDLYKDYNVNVVDIMKENIKKMFGKTNSKTTNEPKNVLNEEQQKKYDKVMDIVKTGAKMAIIASIFGSPSEKKTDEPEDIFASFNNTVNNVKENVSDTINDIGEEVTDSFDNAKENINEFFDEASIVFNDLSKKTAAVTKEGAKVAIEKVSTISTNVSNWAKDVVNDFQEDPVGFALDKIENTAATLALVVSSLSEGVGQFGEAIFDLGVILSSIQSTSAFVTSDIISYGISAITGSEFKSKTLQMWNGTQGFVAKEHITTWVDEWYENNFIGSWINENAYLFEPIRQVGSGVGYTAGVVLLTVLTAGVGGAAVGGGAAAASGGAAAAGSAATSATVTSAQLAMTATAAGIGKGTESAWADGAGIVEGLAAGTASGVWEGIQWYLGGKINSFNPVKGTGVDVKVVNSLARVVLDSIDGAAEGIAQPLIQTMYKDGYYDENGNYIAFNSKDGILKRFYETFDDNGGASSIATNAVIGGIGSTIGEVFDLGRFLKDEKPNTNINTVDTRQSDINNVNIKTAIVDEHGNPINKFDVPNTEGKQIAKNYIDNIDNYLKQGITFEDYLKNQGIDIKRVNNKIELAETLGDGKLYLFDKLKQLSASTNISNEQKIQVNQLLDTYSKLSVGDIDSNRMFDNIKVFLNEDEVNTYLNLSKNGVSDKMASNLSYEQKASVFNYTSAGGLEINAWLNDTVAPNSKKSESARVIFNSIDKIQNLSSGIEAGGRKNWDFRADKGSIIDGLDSVISSAEYDDAIVTYRGVKELWNENQMLDETLLKPGDSFSSSGYQSSSILFEDNYSSKRADSNIILEIIVPPKSGVAAYIENLTGVKKWSQSEVLIKRNATMTVIGDVYQKKINGILKTVVPVVVH